MLSLQTYILEGMKSLHTFRKTIVVALCLVLSASFAFSAPTWTRVNYTSSTAFIGIIKINDYDKDFPVVVEAGDFIGAFVGDECRMVAEVFEYNDELYVSSVIQGGDVADMKGTVVSDPEEVEFRVWDNSANKFVDAQVYGTLFTESAGEIFDYEIGKPNTGKTLKSLSVDTYTLSPAFSSTATEYTISVAYGTSLPSAADYIAVASDSRATVSVEAAKSLDASGNAVSTIIVTAEDGSKTEYTVTFQQEDCPAAVPTATEISDAEFCAGAVSDLVALFGKKSDEAVWYSSATGGTALATGNTFAHGKTEAGEYKFYVARNDGTCESSARLEVSLTIKERPEVKIDVTKTMCSADQPQNLSATPATGVWSGDGVSKSGNSYIFTPEKSSSVMYTYEDGACQVVKTATITVSDTPTPIIDALESSYCSSAASVSLSAEPTGGAFTLNGKEVASFNPAEAKEGANSIKYTVSVNGCEGSKEVSVSVIAAPKIDLSAVEKTACANQEIALAPTTGTWSGTGVTGKTFKSANEGEYKLTYTESVSNCSSTEDVTISVVKASVPSVTPATVELNGTAPALSATGKGTIQWYESETGSSVAEGALFTPTVSTAAEKTFTYYVSNTENDCESEKVAVTLTVTSCSTEAPTIAEVDPVCEGDAFPTLKAVGENITWYDAITDGTKLGTGDTYTPTVEGTYYASQNPGCEGSRASVKVTVKAKPAVPTATSASSCKDAELSAMTTNEDADWYESKTAAPVATNTKSYKPSSLTETKTFYVNRTENGCSSDFVEVVYTIKPLPDVPITDNTKACFNSKSDYIVRVSGSLAAGATLQWYDENDMPKGSATIQDVAVTTAKVYSYSVTQTVDKCTSKPAIALLTVNPLPEPKIQIASSYCSDSKETITLSADLKGGDFMIDDNFEDSFVPNKLSKGTHVVSYTYEDENNCYGDVEANFSIDDCSAPAVTSLTLNKGFLSMVKGDTFNGFVVSIEPDDAPQTVSWSSSDSKVVTVDTEGNLKAVDAGEAVITVTSTYTETKSATCVVTVVAPVENVAFSVDKLEVDEGGFVDLSTYLEINPTNATITSTKWKSNSSSGTISNDGVLTAGIVSENTDVTITVTVTSEDGTSMSADIVVTIVKSCSLSAPIVANASQSICKGENAVTFTATGDAVANWVWENESGAVVSETSSYATDKAGTYYVNQTFGECSGAKTKVTLTVNENPTPSITIESSYCNDSDAFTLTADVTGGVFKVDGKNMTSVNPATMTVGKHTVTYEYTDKNNCSGSDTKAFSIDDCSLPAVTSVVLNKSVLNMQKGDSETLTVSVYPAESPQFVNWKSSNPSVVTVDENGNVKAVGRGTAVVTATSTYTSSKSADCSITVTSPLESVSLSTSGNIVLMEGKTSDLSASLVINPSDAVIVSTTWSSSSSAVSVDNNGVVKANKVAEETTATITVTVVSEEGTTKTANVTVTVKPFTIDLSNLQMKIKEAQDAIDKNEYRRGDKVGNIPSSSFDVLNDAVMNAIALVANPPAEQSTVDAQVILLNSAIKTFLASEVPNKVTELSFESNLIYMLVGEEITPDITFAPEGAYSDLVWTSSNSDVVKVYGSGKIVAQKQGSAAVTASLPSNMSISSRLIIIVKNAPDLVSVSMNNLGNVITMEYSEEMDTPDPQIYTDLYIYGVQVPMYNIMDVQVDPKNAKRILITIGAYIDNPSDLHMRYNGKSLRSKAGGLVESFEYDFESMAADVVTTDAIFAYPTLVSDNVYVSGLTAGMQIKVVSSAGCVVKSQIANGDIDEISVSNLTFGTYYIIVSDGNEIKAKLAFVKK